MSLAASVPTCSDWRLKFNTLHSHGSVVFVLSSFFFVIFLTRVHAQNKEADADLAAWGFFQTLGSQLSSETIIGLILLIINFLFAIHFWKKTPCKSKEK